MTFPDKSFDLLEKIVHWPPTNQWTAVLQPMRYWSKRCETWHSIGLYSVSECTKKLLMPKQVKEVPAMQVSSGPVFMHIALQAIWYPCIILPTTGGMRRKTSATGIDSTLGKGYEGYTTETGGMRGRKMQQLVWWGAQQVEESRRGNNRSGMMVDWSN